MCRHLRWIGFTLLLIATLPFAVAQDKKDLDKEKKPAETLVKAGEVTGTIGSLGENKMLTLKVTRMEPNPSAVQNQQNLLKRQFEIMRNPNPLQRQQQLAQLQVDYANNQRNLYTAKEVSVQLQPADDLKVRSKQPPLAFDDKGNPRKYTEKELKELRGDGSLPGYLSDWESLRAGQAVTVTVARKKDTAAPATPKSKDLDKDLEKKLLETDKPYVTMIVIVGDTPSK